VECLRQNGDFEETVGAAVIEGRPGLLNGLQDAHLDAGITIA
jgi:hypothetical protein